MVQRGLGRLNLLHKQLRAPKKMSNSSRLISVLLDTIPSLKLSNAQLRGDVTDMDLVIHLDLNKSILAVDEVKNYGKEEVVYLEQWKNDSGFLDWAYSVYGREMDQAAWVEDLKLSKNEPTLIAHATEYANLDPARQVGLLLDTH